VQDADAERHAGAVRRERVIGQGGDVRVAVPVRRRTFRERGSADSDALVVVHVHMRLAHRMLVLVLDDNQLAAPSKTPEGCECQQTAAEHPRPPSAAYRRHDHPRAERNECYAHDPLHDFADGRRQPCRRHDDDHADSERGRGVPQRVQRREHDRAAPALL
jgi:hypothetical protein